MEQKKPSIPVWLIVLLALLFVISLGFFLFNNYQAGDSEPWQLIVSGLILSIPLVLLYGSIGLLSAGIIQHHRGQIGPRLARNLFLAPRIAGILIILFVSLFALDMFGTGEPWWRQILGFLIHASPAIAMGALLALAWRREWIGFILFALGALFFMRFVINFRGPIFELGNFLLFVLPMALISALFWVNWKWHDELRQAR